MKAVRSISQPVVLLATLLFPNDVLCWISTHPFAASSAGTLAGSSRTSSAAKESDVSSPTVSERSQSPSMAILLCPAQFCVPADYDDFFSTLRQHVPSLTTCRVAPLPRTEWIKVAQHLPTREFLEARLPVSRTLDWYFSAMERGLADIFATTDDDCDVCIIGHSIGGWVARGYLGGLSQSSTAVHRMAMERCKSLVTLGTPHVSSPEALVDQTRGLLNEIAAAPTCHPQALTDRGIAISCVSSNAVGGNFITTNVEEVVAASSYLPLLGRVNGNVTGDGIVPLDLAFMEEPATRIVVETCSVTQQPVRHAHVLPTPWNLLDGYAPSISLPGESFPSYVSPGVVPQWVHCLSKRVTTPLEPTTGSR